MHGIDFAHVSAVPMNLLSFKSCRFALCALIVASTAVFARAEAIATPPPTSVPTLEQRVAALEAAHNNGDPTVALKDKDGNVPAGLTTPTAGVADPGHNAWMMTSSALVLFMTLPDRKSVV